MTSFELHEPRTIEETTALLAQHGDAARLIAGGTAVVLMLRNRLIAPSALVSLGELDGLRYIRAEDGELRIGAMTTIRELERSPLVMERCPTLARTCRQVANVRVRHAATIGGNLSEADYASDPPAVLVAARARVRLASAKGEREIALTDWFTDFFETAARPDEVVTEVVVPTESPATRGAYVKYVSRSSEDRPCLGVAAFADLDGETCRALRVVVGAAAATPREYGSVEALAAGQRLTPELIQEVAGGYAREIDPIADLRGSAWYRTQLTRVLVRDAIAEALNGQPKESK